jgi:hypothetical protein
LAGARERGVGVMMKAGSTMTNLETLMAVPA